MQERLRDHKFLLKTELLAHTFDPVISLPAPFNFYQTFLVREVGSYCRPEWGESSLL